MPTSRSPQSPRPRWSEPSNRSRSHSACSARSPRLAALAIGALAISRELRSDEDDLSVLRALGASPATTVADGLVGVLGAIVSGALLAVALAISLSPLSPLGPIRAVYHPPGDRGRLDGSGLRASRADWRARRDRAGARLPRLPPTGWLPNPALTSPATRDCSRWRPRRACRPPVRWGSASLSSPVAAAPRSRPAPFSSAPRWPWSLVTMTLTFSSGLHTLVSRPALYGWNWSYALTSENVVPPQALAALNRDPDVAAWSGLPQSLGSDRRPDRPRPLGRTTTRPSLRRSSLDMRSMATTRSSWVPAPLRSCTSALATPSSVRSAPRTPPRSTSLPSSWSSRAPPRSPQSAAPATSPTTLPWEPEPSCSDHVSPAFLHAAQEPRPQSRRTGPGLRAPPQRSERGSRTGGHETASPRSPTRSSPPTRTRRATASRSWASNTPREIVNYQSTGATPVILAAGLAGGAIVALALTLIASVRRRRTGSRPAEDPRVHGPPVGRHHRLAGLGHRRHRRPHRSCPSASRPGGNSGPSSPQSINAVPEPTVPASLLLVAAGVLILANLVAARPGAHCRPHPGRPRLAGRIARPAGGRQLVVRRARPRCARGHHRRGRGGTPARPGGTRRRCHRHHQRRPRARGSASCPRRR